MFWISANYLKKGAKSIEEIKITQGFIELNKDANKRDKNVIIIGTLLKKKA